jgi:hypothetical protein
LDAIHHIQGFALNKPFCRLYLHIGPSSSMYNVPPFRLVALALLTRSRV